MTVCILDEDARRVMLALDELLRHDEGVEATLPGGETVTTSHTASKTHPCPKCLRTADDGAEFSTGQSYCKDCTRRWKDETNARTQPHAEHHREPWSELEVEMLLEAVAEGMPQEEIAVLLGRTYHATHGKLQNVRRLLEMGFEVTYITRTITTTTTTATIRKDPNYVASQPDEDRWWEPSYYKGENV